MTLAPLARLSSVACLPSSAACLSSQFLHTRARRDSLLPEDRTPPSYPCSPEQTWAPTLKSRPGAAACKPHLSFPRFPGRVSCVVVMLPRCVATGPCRGHRGPVWCADGRRWTSPPLGGTIRPGRPRSRPSPARCGAVLGYVSHPQPVRGVRGELAIHQAGVRLAAGSRTVQPRCRRR